MSRHTTIIVRERRAPDTPGRDGVRRGRLWRSRWAAIGAAVTVALGGGTLHLAGATDSEPSAIVSIDPTRILDTRDPVHLGLAGPFVSAVGQDLRVTGPVPTPNGTRTVVPDGATGVLLNITVVQPTAAGFVSVRPSGTPGPPETSSLNFDAGDITPNAVFVALPTDGDHAGSIEITYDAFGTSGPTTDVLGDVVGFTMGNPDVYTKSEADATFLTEIDAYRKAEADATFATKSELADDHLTEQQAVERFAPVYAVVGEEGQLERGRGAVEVSWIPSPPYPTPGVYYITFDRDVSACVYQATGREDALTSITRPDWLPADRIRVQTYSSSGFMSERSFSVVVHC